MRKVLTLSLGMAAASVAVAGLAGCGDSADTAADGPRIVVSTSIVGDLVSSLVGDLAPVEVVVPAGVDPHEFALSARQADAVSGADLVVVVGGSLEPSMDDVVAAAEDDGVAVFRLVDHVDTLDVADSPGTVDPHVWLDPRRVAAAMAELAGEIPGLDGFEALDRDALASQAEAFAAQLAALDAEVDGLLAVVPGPDRLLVTDHDVLAYFADRYGFEVVGAVVPAVTTGGGASAVELEELAALIDALGVPAIFTEAAGDERLAEALGDLVDGDVELVGLYAESLGAPGSGAATYAELMRTDARLVADALGGAGS